MTVTQTDPRPHMTAIRTALDATLAPNKSYPVDAIPGTSQNATAEERTKPLPNMYVELGLEPRYVEPSGMFPRASRGGWRITTVCVGRSINECFWVMDRVARALRNQYLTVDSQRVGPVFAETPRGPEWDNVRWSAQMSWTYST